MNATAEKRKKPQVSDKAFIDAVLKNPDITAVMAEVKLKEESVKARHKDMTTSRGIWLPALVIPSTSGRMTDEEAQKYAREMAEKAGIKVPAATTETAPAPAPTAPAA